MLAIAVAVIGFAVLVWSLWAWHQETRSRSESDQILDVMLFSSGIPFPYRLPYESVGDALERLMWHSAQKWVQDTSGVVSLFELDHDSPTIPNVRSA